MRKRLRNRKGKMEEAKKKKWWTRKGEERGLKDK